MEFSEQEIGDWMTFSPAFCGNALVRRVSLLSEPGKVVLGFT